MRRNRSHRAYGAYHRPFSGSWAPNPWINFTTVTPPVDTTPGAQLDASVRTDQHFAPIGPGSETTMVSGSFDPGAVAHAR
jgi:hypothetical protein